MKTHYFKLKPNNTLFRDLSGLRFARWTVVGYGGRSSNQVSLWVCRCLCRRIKTVKASTLTTGKSLSCGCIRNEQLREMTTIHGYTAKGQHKLEYSSYKAALNRCQDPTHRSYPIYGGRGIEFRFASFECFLATLGKRPSKLFSLDRIDVNGHYEPGNVRWATASEQAINRRPKKH